MRQTSIDTYRQIKEEGLLSKLRFITYECIFQFGPITQTECWTKLKLVLNAKNGHQSIAPRFAELKNLGVIQEIETRACAITGRRCIAWDVTNKLPVKFERITKDEIINELREQKRILLSLFQKPRFIEREEQLQLTYE